MLRESLRVGDLESAQQALEAGADANSSASGFPLICTVAGSGNLEALKMLLDHGADVNARDLAGCTPVVFAATLCHDDKAVPMLDALLAAGADLHAKSGKGESAIDLAAQIGSLSGLQWLMDHRVSGKHASQSFVKRRMEQDRFREA